MGSLAATGSMASPASRVLPEMASKAHQETLATQEHPEPRASQERWAPRDWACQAPRASRVSLEMQGYLAPQASQDLPAPQAVQDR